MIDRTRAPQKDCIGSRIRVGAVTYLNSKPLIEGLDRLGPGIELVLDYPSRLADDLARGRLDVALIPSVEAFSDPDYEVVSNACVATHGPVFSVKLYSRVPPGQIRTLSLDEGSRTSAALAQVMLNERFGVQPQLSRLPLGTPLKNIKADALVVIGDRAMHPPEETFHTVWDLGEEWLNWTGLPFVFAMWVARADARLGDLPQQLDHARDLGLRNVHRIARQGAATLQLPEDLALRYLQHNLHFHLGSAELQGLQLFHELAGQHGFAGNAPLAIRGRKLNERRPIEELSLRGV